MVRQLSQRTRNRVSDLLTRDQLGSERLVQRLRELRALEGAPVFAGVMYNLAHLSLAEEEAEELFLGLLDHRESVARILDRDPGLRVAAIDYLSNVKSLLRNPTIVELSELEMTERSAVTDSLTELYNRRYFENSLDIEVRRSERYGLCLALLMLDLDSFKAVNDLYGHPFGDLVLMRAGQLIRSAVRESDVPCRFGGEEFAVVLPETDRLGAFAVAERVRLRIQRGFADTLIDGRAVAMTISGGIACYPEDGHDPAVLTSWADRALYHSKTHGRNRITVYHAERREALRFPVRESSRTRISHGEGAAADVKAINLSASGILLATPEALRPRDPIELMLGAKPERWVVPGRVVRVERSSRQPRGNLVAIAFDEPLTDECLQRHTEPGRQRLSPAGGVR